MPTLKRRRPFPATPSFSSQAPADTPLNKRLPTSKVSPLLLLVAMLGEKMWEAILDEVAKQLINLAIGRADGVVQLLLEVGLKALLGVGQQVALETIRLLLRLLQHTMMG